MSGSSSLQITEMDISVCKERLEYFIELSTASARRNFILALICLISALVMFFLSVNGFGAAILIASAYFWQESNKAEMQGNVAVTLYPLALLVNSHTADLKAIKADLQILATSSDAANAN